MKPEVRDAFPTFTDAFEGRTGYLYTDVFGLVTTGRGNLVDYGYRRSDPNGPQGASDPAPALSLGWHVSASDPTLATAQQIRSQWFKVKAAWPATQSVHCEWLTSIRLYLSDIDALTYRKLDEMWAQLLRIYPGAEDWPACAQLGLISMAWAMGASFNFPKFHAAALARDWLVCMTECAMDATHNPGLEPRNAANRALFHGAFAGFSIDEALHPARPPSPTIPPPPPDAA
jgi:GH24 family phage-related lysozyme (muramidase)